MTLVTLRDHTGARHRIRIADLTAGRVHLRRYRADGKPVNPVYQWWQKPSGGEFVHWSYLILPPGLNGGRPVPTECEAHDFEHRPISRERAAAHLRIGRRYGQPITKQRVAGPNGSRIYRVGSLVVTVPAARTAAPPVSDQRLALRAASPIRATCDQDVTIGLPLFDRADQPGLFD